MATTKAKKQPTITSEIAERLAKINAAVAEATAKRLKQTNPSQALASSEQPYVCPLDPGDGTVCASCQ